MSFQLHLKSLLLAALSLFMLPTPLLSKEIEYEMDLKSEYRAPDGLRRPVITVNGEFLTYEIRCGVGDTLKVTVKNHLHVTPVSIHWHGFEMMGQPWFDGTSYVTQCPIGPTDFVYYFKCNETPGTYWWHGHNGELLADGLLGPLIVEDYPSFKRQYDEEYTLVLNDWYHRDSHYIVTGLEGPSPANPETGFGFTWPGDPRSFLFNGKGMYDCANFSEQEGEDLCNEDFASLETFKVEAGKTYLLRLIGAFTLSYTTFAIEGHKMTIVRTDGQRVKYTTVDSIDINSGERYDVLITAD